MLVSIPLFIQGWFILALACFLVGAFLVLVIPIGKSLWSNVFRHSPTITIDTAKIGQDDVATFIPLRAKELVEGVRLDALYEIHVPPLAENFGAGDKFSLPEDFKFEIQGVDVPKVVTSVLKILPEDNYTVKVEPVPSSADTIRLEWKPPGGKAKVWLLRPEKTDPPDSKRMVDRVIARILFYLNYDPEGPQELQKKLALATSGKAKFPNARALEAYLVGQQYLNAYLADPEDPTPLANAETEFRRLQQEMPEFIDGLMLLGITLSERRNEADAVLAYGRAKVLLDQHIKGLNKELDDMHAARDRLLRKRSTDALQQNIKEAKQAERRIEAKQAEIMLAEKTRAQANLFQANAYRKLYNWRDLVRSVVQLDEAEGRLADLLANSLARQDKLEFKKIRAAVLAEKAETIGYGLILLYPETFIDALKDLAKPASLAQPHEFRAKLVNLAPKLRVPVPSDDTIKERNTLYVAALISLAGKQEEALNDARGALKNVSIFDDASETEKAAWASEKKRIEGVLLAAEGYGTFRKAQFFYPDTKTGNKDFAKQCEAALQNLQEADSRQPNQYLLLQDLGIIYGDARYDYRNQKIGVAKRYFERSLKIKPDDYFGYQNLAILAVRQAFASGAQLDSATLDAAITNANKSLESRPSNGTVFVALAQLYALYWSIESDADKKKKWVAAYGSSIENARSAGASASRISAAELQWGLIRLRAAADDPAPTDPPATTPAKAKAGEFSFEKDEYVKKLDNARQEASKLPGWEARQLMRVIDDLKTKVAAATSDKREGLIWPPAPISPPNDDP